jgi:hypothetical protein
MSEHRIGITFLRVWAPKRNLSPLITNIFGKFMAGSKLTGHGLFTREVENLVVENLQCIAVRDDLRCTRYDV